MCHTQHNEMVFDSCAEPLYGPLTFGYCGTSSGILGSPFLWLGLPPKQTGFLCPPCLCRGPPQQSSSIYTAHHAGSVPSSQPLLGWTQAAQTGQQLQKAEEGGCSSIPCQDCSPPGPLQSRFWDPLWRG